MWSFNMNKFTKVSNWNNINTLPERKTVPGDRKTEITWLAVCFKKKCLVMKWLMFITIVTWVVIGTNSFNVFHECKWNYERMKLWPFHESKQKFSFDKYNNIRRINHLWSVIKGGKSSGLVTLTNSSQCIIFISFT